MVRTATAARSYTAAASTIRRRQVCGVGGGNGIAVCTQTADLALHCNTVCG